ncbi:hypothetical protein NDU88_004776 [Pleurodeles waltl]|uniref:ribonuclease H n=1 Tax=Pleurodeles waltl TaxID=8319 RepID=A0AAV7KZC5_PLEWA|nr:hypothetical protein NDU88_004776 [Pleurodeles waltl]
MWDECGVTYRFTTPYHPQSNRLVERFNKTLKGMITGLPEARRRKKDVLLPCLLLACRKVPQKRVGFSLFELLYGHPVRGPLSRVKEGWEKAPKKPPHDVVSYKLALCTQIQCFWKQAKSNLEASQEVMKEWFDRKATLVEFSPGNKVWVMKPVEPFEIKEEKGEATYLVDLKTPRHPLRVLHHNRQKPYFERSEVSMLLVTDEGQEEENERLPDLISAKESDGSVEGVNLSDSPTLDQKGDCYELLVQFSFLFSLTPGLTHLCVHDIDTGESPPVKNKIYRVSDKVRSSIKDEVSKMLALGVIEKSISPWSSSVVPKAAAPGAKTELRFCMDYRGLNSVTKTDAHPIRRADELVDRLGADKFLSTFDFTSGYWQIALTKGAQERSTFSNPEGHYQFRVMPFGLKKRPPLPSNGWLTGS